MAKEKAPAKETKTEKTFKYGVKDLADMLDIEPAAVRIKLRSANVEKAANGAYGWDSKDDLKAVADKLKVKKEKAPAKETEKASTKKDAPAKDTKKAANDKGAKKSGKKAA